jgi:hypothetical protein
MQTAPLEIGPIILSCDGVNDVCKSSAKRLASGTAIEPLVDSGNLGQIGASPVVPHTIGSLQGPE